MITLRADNKVLVQGAKYAYLVDNYSSGTSSLTLTNVEDFVVDSFVLVSEMGKSDVEIFRIGSITGVSNILTLKDAAGASATTRFAHPESTKITIIPYNQIRFYWTAALGTIADESPTFDIANPLTSWVDIEPASSFTTYDDANHSTGFGWFIYRNSVTSQSSQTSNAIPYAGFEGNTVAAVFADFDSLLNTNDQKLVTIFDKFSWLNEALAVLKNKLNLTNTEFTVSTPQTLTILGGTAEYQLPPDFSDVVEITTGLNTSTSQGDPIPFMSVSKIMAYNGDTVHYYLRGRYIGFAPTPGASATYYYRYRAKSTAVTSVSTYINLPDDAFYALKSWMLYRALSKFSNPMAQQYHKDFNNSVDLYVQSFVKRSANLDSWEIQSSSNT